MPTFELSSSQSLRELSDLIDQHPLVLVDFWAPWCAPCRAMLPSLEELALDSRLNLIKINADEHPQLVQHYQVRGLPCLMVWHHGQQVQITHETLSFSQLKEWLASYLPDEAGCLLEQALLAQGEQRLRLLRQAEQQHPEVLAIQEALLLELFEQRQQPAFLQELQTHLHRLSAEQLRSPTLSRLQSVLAFSVDLEQQPAFLKPAYQLALEEQYSQALEQLLLLLEQPLTGEQEKALKTLATRILNLMPERRLANQFRRKLM